MAIEVCLLESSFDQTRFCCIVWWPADVRWATAHLTFHFPRQYQSCLPPVTENLEIIIVSLLTIKGMVMNNSINNSAPPEVWMRCRTCFVLSITHELCVPIPFLWLVQLNSSYLAFTVGIPLTKILTSFYRATFVSSKENHMPSLTPQLCLTALK